MSRTAIIFIEFRENSSKPWELFCPLMKKSYQDYQNGYICKHILATCMEIIEPHKAPNT